MAKPAPRVPPRLRNEQAIGETVFGFGDIEQKVKICHNGIMFDPESLSICLQFVYNGFSPLLTETCIEIYSHGEVLILHRVRMRGPQA